MELWLFSALNFAVIENFNKAENEQITQTFLYSASMLNCQFLLEMITVHGQKCLFQAFSLHKGLKFIKAGGR